MIPYRSEEATKKLQEAIELGFIYVEECPDGVLFYALTDKGTHQWMLEKMDGGMPWSI